MRTVHCSVPEPTSLRENLTTSEALLDGADLAASRTGALLATAAAVGENVTAADVEPIARAISRLLTCIPIADLLPALMNLGKVFVVLTLLGSGNIVLMGLAYYAWKKYKEQMAEMQREMMVDISELKASEQVQRELHSQVSVLADEHRVCKVKDSIHH